MPCNPSAADATQQANSTIWKKRSDFTPGSHFKAWVFSIARYEVLNFRKRQTREDKRLVFSDTLEDLIAEELPEHATHLEDRQAALRHYLTKLRGEDRELVQHRYFHRNPLKEYAEQIQRSASSPKGTLHRIRTALAKYIEIEISKEGNA
ncbi:MAG: RNA polymerase sigma-70 factor (ECF subfamily) [Verrucomicrobiales bacterium]|jgi:RNA polymerase sigma-70 factor (ECF subfamily)